jgi:hypothetical protein
MTATGWGFVDQDAQLFGRTLGEIVAQMVKRRFPRNTAKSVEAAWDLDPTTARNVVRGHCSERTLAKAIRAEGWALAAPLIESMTGQTYEQHLQILAEEADRVREQIEARRERLRRLQGKAACEDGLSPG